MVRAFILGAMEFRRTVTTSVPDATRNAYESGREFAHRLTCRRFEPF